MKNHYDRRKFLKASILGMGAFFVSVSPLKLFGADVLQNTPDENDAGPDLLFAQAKEFFYKKEYARAASVYQQLIKNNPQKYIYYDGYAHVLGAQQKMLEIAELYREGLILNPDNPYFMQRLALRIYDICMGNRKAELEFCKKHGEDMLFESSAGLLLQAVNLKNNKGFYLSLRDVLRAVDKKNIYLESKNLPPVSFSAALQDEIKSVTSRFESKWETTRASRRPAAPENADKQLEKIKNRKRRHFYNEKERKEFDKSMHEARKCCRKQAMEAGLKLNNANKVERYAMAVLEEAPNDTDTISKLRKYYRKEKKHDKIIALNRYLYSREKSLENTLALANSLARYGKNKRDFNEAKNLLKPYNAAVKSFTPVHAVSYYTTNALAHSKTNHLKAAREILLQGLSQLEENIGKSYILLEQYAAISSMDKGKSVAADLLKTLSRNNTLGVDKALRADKDDPVWKYADSYLELIADVELSRPEQLKPLYALLKMQKGKSGDYRRIEREINLLKNNLEFRV